MIDLEESLQGQSCLWTNNSTEQLIEIVKKQKPAIYFQMKKDGKLDAQLLPINFYNQAYLYEQALVYGIVDNIKIDYSLLTSEEIAQIISLLLKEIPAFEQIIEDNKKAQNNCFDDFSEDLKKMKCHLLFLRNLLKMRLDNCSVSPKQFGEE